MADRTTSTIFYPSNNPSKIEGKTSASNGDTFAIPYGQLKACLTNPEDDDDAISTATVSGLTVTLAVTDDAGAAVTADSDINFIAILRFSKMTNAATDIQYGKDFYKEGTKLPDELAEHFKIHNPSLLDSHIEINGTWKLIESLPETFIEENKNTNKRIKDYLKNRENPIPTEEPKVEVKKKKGKK